MQKTIRKILSVNPTTKIIIIKCEWYKNPNQKAEMIRLEKKVRWNYKLSKRDSPQI